jgi:hypothetical protein
MPVVLGVVNGARSAAQSKFREALDEQVQSKQAHKAAVRKFERNSAAKMAQEVSHELAVQRDFDQAARVLEREMLASAWREHQKIRDIKKTIESLEGGHVEQAPRQGTPRSMVAPPWGTGAERERNGSCHVGTPREGRNLSKGRAPKPGSGASAAKSTGAPASACTSRGQRSIASAASALMAASQCGSLSARCCSRPGTTASLGAAAALALQ